LCPYGQLRLKTRCSCARNIVFLRSTTLKNTMFLCSKHCVPALKNIVLLRSTELKNMMFQSSNTMCSCAQQIVFLRSTALKNIVFLRSKTKVLSSNLQGVPQSFYFISPIFTHVSFGYYSIKISRKRKCNKEREKKEQLNDTATTCCSVSDHVNRLMEVHSRTGSFN
jgi:hypothetical protein